MIDDVRLVSTRGRHQIAELGISCDSREVPHFVSGDTRWMAVARYVGTAFDEDGDGSHVDVSSAAVLTVSAGRVCGILSTDARQPAVWFSAGPSGLVATGDGSMGLFRKRPAGVRVRIAQGELYFTEVGRMLPSGRTVQAHQEAEFLAALSR
jgi:hypothetical protein